MKRTIRHVTLLGTAGAVIACVWIWTRSPPNDVDTVIRNANVIDLRVGEVLPAKDIYIVAGRIVDVRSARNTPMPNTARIVEAEGKFVIPGLWDMHVHWFERETLPLFVANGVVGIRQMWGMTMHYQLRAEGIEGTPKAPRQLLGSPIVDGPGSVWPGTIVAASPKEGEDIVKLFSQSGAEFLKVYSKLSRETYLAMTAAAAARNLPVDGHIPPTVSWAEAIEAGHRSVEHLTEIEYSVSARGAELAQEMAALYGQMTGEGISEAASENRLARGKVTTAALDSIDKERQRSLLSELARKPVWQCPTLIVSKTLLAISTGRLDDSPLHYLSGHHRYLFSASQHQSPIEHQLRPYKARWLKFKQGIVADMSRAGVPLLAGSDVGNPYVYPGFSLHDELELLVDSELSPLAALRTATVNPARLVGREAEFGYVEPGMRADLLVLDGNPLIDIHNTRRINTVVIGGHVLDRSALDDILQRARDSAKRPHVEEVLLGELERGSVEAAIGRYMELREHHGSEYSFSLFSRPLLIEKLSQAQRWQDVQRLLELAASGPLSDEAVVHEGLADLYLKFRRPADAKAAYERALELAPGAPGVMLKMSQL